MAEREHKKGRENGKEKTTNVYDIGWSVNPDINRLTVLF